MGLWLGISYYFWHCNTTLNHCKTCSALLCYESLSFNYTLSLSDTCSWRLANAFISVRLESSQEKYDFHTVHILLQKRTANKKILFICIGIVCLFQRFAGFQLTQMLPMLWLPEVFLSIACNFLQNLRCTCTMWWCIQNAFHLSRCFTAIIGWR